MTLTENELAPVQTHRALANTYKYGAGTVSILIDGEDTGGAFALVDVVQKPGAEPPLHVHETEDETFYVLEGEIDVLVGGEKHNLSAGGAIFLPRGIPHTFRIKSPVAHALNVLRPAGFEQWFRELGTPAEDFDLPLQPPPPSPELFARMQRLGERLRVYVLPGEVDL